MSAQAKHVEELWGPSQSFSSSFLSIQKIAWLVSFHWLLAFEMEVRMIATMRAQPFHVCSQYPTTLPPFQRHFLSILEFRVEILYCEANHVVPKATSYRYWAANSTAAVEKAAKWTIHPLSFRNHESLKTKGHHIGNNCRSFSWKVDVDKFNRSGWTIQATYRQWWRTTPNSVRWSKN